MRLLEPIRWVDFFGTEHLLINGKGDDVFHVIPEQRNDEGESFVEILSKKALLEFAKQVQSVVGNETK
jgi:hypothetical protein